MPWNNKEKKILKIKNDIIASSLEALKPRRMLLN